MLTGTLSMIGVGFSLGLMHALDADHVMAVSALSSRKPNFFQTLRFSASWALGHGGVLLAAGALLFGLGLSIPASLQMFAEASVGALLIGLGLWCFWRFRTQGLHLHKHRHGPVEHVHWHTPEHPLPEQGEGNHAPVMVGMLHGLAGSAPALGLVPVVAQGNAWMAMGYLVLFSLGVMLSMLCFGSGLGSVQRYFQHHFEPMFVISRYAIAAGSVALGTFWLYQAV